MITDAKLARSYRLLMWGALIAILTGCRGDLPPVETWCDVAAMDGTIALLPPAEGTGGIIDTTTPTFSWAYTGECDVSEFGIIVSRYPDPLYTAIREDVVPSPSTGTYVGEGVGEVGPIYSWTPDASLERGHVYYWRIRANSGLNEGPRSEWRAFKIGPRCHIGTPLEPVQLYRPGDGQFVESYPVHFMWSDPSPCYPYAYALQISTRASFPDSETDTYMTQWPDQEVHLDVCTSTYYWRVRSYAPHSPPVPIEDFAAESPVFTFSIPPGPASCGVPTAASPSSTGVTVTLPAPPLARVLTDARCRSGPGIVYPLLTFVSQGQSFPIQGRNADSTWWWIDRPDGDCWLADSVVETEGNTGSVPEQQAPPTPTVTPELGCWQQLSPNLPNRCVVPCPADVQNPTYCTP
ncbi:MAG: hypothetical protein A2Y93_13550 [Chloroflexi bacterium RBG_13_68_17]|nr:MAG: hypothetical protein A2Y93_13550 [Chloroflexi bacterium RBG_13_68_17]